MPAEPDKPFRKSARVMGNPIKDMAVSEEYGSPPHAHEVFADAREGLGGKHIVIAVKVYVFPPVADESLRDLRVRLEASSQLVHSLPVCPSGKGFKDVAKKDDLFKIRLHEFEEPQEFMVIVSESIGFVTAAYVEVGNNRYSHHLPPNGYI